MKYQSRYLQAQTTKKKDVRFIGRWFVIAILCFAALFGWLWHDGVFYFDFECSHQKALVTEVNLVPVRGMFYSVKYLQGVHYSYTFNGQSYFGIEQIGKKLGKIEAGDSIAIDVLKRRPQVSEVKYP